MRLLALLLILVFGIAGSICASTNLLTNGNFETGNLTGWTSWNAEWSNGHQSIVQTLSKKEGMYSLLLRFQSGAGSFGVYQEVDVIPGQTYQVSGWWKGSYNGDTNWFEVLLLDGVYNFDQVDKPGVCQNNFVSAYDPALQQFLWEPISAAYVTTPYINSGMRTATGNKMTVVLKVGGFGTPSGYFDDIRMEVVPEPSSLIALAGGGMFLAGMMRRRR